MGSRTYLCSVCSDSTVEERSYIINHRSAMKAAEKYGRCESSETITVRTHLGKTLSMVKWDPQTGKYININFD